MCHPKEKCSYHPNCTSNQMLGHLLKMFCSGWSMEECRQLYRNINSIQPSVLVEVKSPFNRLYLLQLYLRKKLRLHDLNIILNKEKHIKVYFRLYVPDTYSLVYEKHKYIYVLYIHIL